MEKNCFIRLFFKLKQLINKIKQIREELKQGLNIIFKIDFNRKETKKSIVDLLFHLSPSQSQFPVSEDDLQLVCFSADDHSSDWTLVNNSLPDIDAMKKRLENIIMENPSLDRNQNSTDLQQLSSLTNEKIGVSLEKLKNYLQDLTLDRNCLNTFTVVYEIYKKYEKEIMNHIEQCKDASISRIDRQV